MLPPVPVRRIDVLIALGFLGACAPRSVTVASVPATARGDAAGSVTTADAPAAASMPGWRLGTREHVDLWLHGFAMVSADSSLVPTFRLSYRQSASIARQAVGARSLLDDNALVLSRRVAGSPTLASAHFVALYFASWDELRRGCERFLRDDGNLRAARDDDALRMYATLNTYFPTAGDRDWLRLFLQSLDDEYRRFFQANWRQTQTERASVRAAIDAAWRDRYAAAFSRFLTGTSQRFGTVLLSPTLGGEGRSLDVGRRDNFIAVTLPAASEDPRDAFYVIAHEVVGTVSNAVVREQTSQADQMSGESGRLSTLAAVRGGAMLLDRIAPELAEGYRRYYLTGARQPLSADVSGQFDRIFALPAHIVTALGRQLDLVLNGL